MGPRLIEDAQLLVDAGLERHPHLDARARTSATGGDASSSRASRSAPTATWLDEAARGGRARRRSSGIDYHHRLSVAEAASFCQRMPPGTLDFLEEPIRDETPEAYEALRRMADVPFAIGEEFASKWQFLPFIERGLTQFARVDVCNVGGLTEAMKVAGWCEAHYIDLMPHNPLGPICTAATVHLAAAVTNFAWLECRNSPTEELGVLRHGVLPGAGPAGRAAAARAGPARASASSWTRSWPRATTFQIRHQRISAAATGRSRTGESAPGQPRGFREISRTACRPDRVRRYSAASTPRLLASSPRREAVTTREHRE